jgi:transposase
MQVYIGIDWSEDKHEVVFMNAAGAEIATLTISHDLEGFLQFDAARRKLGLQPQDCQIGLETAHTLFIDFLWSQNYPHIYVLPPNQVRSNQGRFRQSGARDDHSDGRLIADILRTDRGRLQPWRPDKLLTRQMQANLSLIDHLDKHIHQFSNRLRSVLLRYYPAALEAFKTGLAAQITLELVLAYPNPQAAQQLDYQKFVDFTRQHRYPDHRRLPACFTRLQANDPPPCAETVQIYQPQAVYLAKLLLESMRTRIQTLAELQRQYRQHPHHAIFASLPGTGEVIGPGLLVKFGDDRERFPSARSAQSLAGTCPVTDKSGKRRTVLFRRACDKEWRDLCQQWAMALVNKTQAPIAVAYYNQIRPHCHSDSHAYRCVANRWLAIAWKLWVTGKTYDPAYHFQQHAARSKPRQ